MRDASSCTSVGVPTCSLAFRWWIDWTCVLSFCPLHLCRLFSIKVWQFLNLVLIHVASRYPHSAFRQIGNMLNAREPKIVNGPQILDKFVGESEANIRKLFAEAEEEEKRVRTRLKAYSYWNQYFKGCLLSQMLCWELSYLYSALRRPPLWYIVLSQLCHFIFMCCHISASHEEFS